MYHSGQFSCRFYTGLFVTFLSREYSSAGILIIHLVKYIPDWFPGAGFETTARRFRENLNKAAQDPFNFTKAGLVSD